MKRNQLSLQRWPQADKERPIALVRGVWPKGWWFINQIMACRACLHFIKDHNMDGYCEQVTQVAGRCSCRVDPARLARLDIDRGTP